MPPTSVSTRVRRTSSSGVQRWVLAVINTSGASAGSRPTSAGATRVQIGVQRGPVVGTGLVIVTGDVVVTGLAIGRQG